MVKLLLMLFVLNSALLCANPGLAVRIRVSQESRPDAGDFREHVVGHIEPFLTPQKTGVADFYAYDQASRFSFNGKRPRLKSETSHLFFVQAMDQLTLFLIHDAVDNLDGGSAVVDIRVIGDPDGVSILLRDDPYSESDAYETTEKGAVVKAWHSWFPCCTDGLVVGRLEGNWKVLVRFAPAWAPETIRGLRGWEAVSQYGRFPLQLEPGRRVLLEPVGSLVKGSANGPSSGSHSSGPDIGKPGF